MRRDGSSSPAPQHTVEQVDVLNGPAALFGGQAEEDGPVTAGLGIAY